MAGLLFGVSQMGVLGHCQLCSSCAGVHAGRFAGSGEPGLDTVSYPPGPRLAQGYCRDLLKARLG